MSQAVVEVRHLCKSYTDVTAVNDVSFRMEENRIYGFLGRNGVGKTTIMHMITAQLFPTSGEVKVFGQSPYENEAVLRNICFIKEGQRYPDYFTVKDVLDVASTIFPNWDAAYANELMEEFRLPRKRIVKKLSRGMLSSVGIVVGLASRAPLTIFDEPYLGLDAVAREMFYDHLIEDYTRYPRTVVLSTHLIDEVSRLLEHVIVIDQGRVILDAESEELRGCACTVVGPADKVEAFVQGKKVIRREPFASMISATVMGETGGAIQQEAEQAGLKTSAVSLQDLIVSLTRVEKAVNRG
ncbi:ABC transporter ATP-binding protein [Paenibacillus cisolokensis]|uniref:ABC transporter ATP-binding protein n=1 Tax=Paenibacillus cisolokensis TaxID=1658519 RepID=UPI003D2C9C45